MKIAEKKNLAIFLKCKVYIAQWFFIRYWHYLKLYKFRVLFGSLFLTLDIKYKIHTKVYNFFTDGRIPKSFKKKVVTTKENPLKVFCEPRDFGFSAEISDKFIEFFLTEDNKLIKGIPRWLLVEAVIEVYGISAEERIVREFYKITNENPVFFT